MKNKINIKTILIISSLLVISILLIIQTRNSQITFSKNFIQGLISGLAAVAILVWLISLFKVFITRKKTSTKNKLLFSHPPFLLSAGMLSLFTGILSQQLTKDNIFMYIITIFLIGLAIVFLLSYFTKTRKEINH